MVTDNLEGLTMWARIENEVVMELTDIDPDGRFSSALHWISCPTDTEVWMIFQDGQFFPAPAHLEQ